ncbi:NACHT domain-containing protein [Nocardioides sp. PD653-B2]|nr:hypothetical protein [Nocardioides sp. PD653-B2]
MSPTHDRMVDVPRFWTPSGTVYSTTASGWLADPDREGLFAPNPHVRMTQELGAQRCLVLLGEPGMGKTSALKSNGPLLPESASGTAVTFDLGTYTSEDRLARVVFENETVSGWETGTHTLCLTLDGFDEAQGRIPNLGRLLISYLEHWSTDRLFLRIACRTADWPHALRDELAEHFGDIGVHELLPLRRTDALSVLGSTDADPEALLTAFETARMVPLAARPLTLNLLRASIGPDGSFPRSTPELFERGLLALVDEMNQHRRATVATPGAVRDRFNAATRIAAISLLGSRPAVWIGPAATADPADITVDDCIRADLRVEERRHAAEAVHATLRSGMFTGGGENRLSWSHATFADYLAAKWLIDSKLDDQQIDSLLLATSSQIYSRLRQLAAWLVALDADRFRRLIPADPVAFLASVDLPDESVRRELVDAILLKARDSRLFDDYEVDFSGLAHADLAEQLRPVLAEADGDAARIAVRIARQSRVLGAVPDLTRLALNDAAGPGIRTSAALGVHDLSVASPSHDLASLVRPADDSDLEDVAQEELQAAALMASWPHAISTDEVFAVLEPRYRRNYHGLYSVFLSDFANKLTAADLEPACRWLLDKPDRVDDSRLTALTQAVLRLCSENLHLEHAQEVITKVALRRADEYQSLFEDPELGTPAFVPSLDTRREIALLLLEAASEEQIWSLVETLHSNRQPLLDTGDLTWLLDQYRDARGELQANIGRAAEMLYRPEQTDHSTIVLSLSADDPAAALFTYWRTAIDLASPEAQSAQANWAKHRERRRNRERRESEDDNDAWINPRITEHAIKARQGDPDSFWQAVHLITVRPGTTRHKKILEPDLIAHPRWETLTDATRQNLVAAASTYLERGRCQPGEWLAKDKWFYPAQGGFRALMLLARANPDALASISPATWREWAPIIVEWPVMHDAARADDKRMLLRLALPHARSELTATALTLVDKAVADGNHLLLRDELQVLDSPELAEALARRLGLITAPAPRNALLEVLLENNPAHVIPILHSWIDDNGRAAEPGRARDAVIRLLHHNAAESWPMVANLLGSAPAFMESALQDGSHAFDRRVPALSEPDLASLYIWLEQHFPSQEDPKFDDAHFIGPREAIGTWRDAILTELGSTGTRAAVDAVDRIAAAFPRHSWISRISATTERAVGERSWSPVSPEELDQLAANRSTRLVRTDADLLGAALAALLELQDRLQADTPSATLLWDTFAGRPKTEDEISDFIKIELDQRLHRQGAIVNREVQVRRTKPTGLPERSDLRIEALPADDRMNPATVCIPGEVKGAWNRDVVGALSSQLVDRYMADLQTNHGLYIVAWFDQRSWTDASDSRRGAAARFGGIEELRAALQNEVDRLTNLGRQINVVVLDASIRRQSHRSS